MQNTAEKLEAKVADVRSQNTSQDHNYSTDLEHQFGELSLPQIREQANAMSCD